MVRTTRRTLGAILAAAAFGSCGGGSPSSPSDPPGGPNSGITVTITSSGVNPKQITVPQGTRVLFVNNDSQGREIYSDPHPEHTNCVEINNIGLISPGQTKETGNVNTVKTCGYHDHLNPGDARFKGSIVIQ